jgi:glutaredoxin
MSANQLAVVVFAHEGLDGLRDAMDLVAHQVSLHALKSADLGHPDIARLLSHLFTMAGQAARRVTTPIVSMAENGKLLFVGHPRTLWPTVIPQPTLDIYGVKGCPKCQAASQMGYNLIPGAQVRLHDVAEDASAKAFVQEIAADGSTVPLPQVFLNGEYVGDKSDLENLAGNDGGAHKVIIYGNEGCPACRDAKAFVATLPGVTFEYKDIADPTIRDEHSALAQTYHHDTIPMVFVDGTFIGGNTELHRWAQQQRDDNAAPTVTNTDTLSQDEDDDEDDDDSMLDDLSSMFDAASHQHEMGAVDMDDESTAPDDETEASDDSPVVTIYGKHSCGACVYAKNLVEGAGLVLEFRDIDADLDAARFLDSRGIRAVPYILIDGEPVGGVVELQRALEGMEMDVDSDAESAATTNTASTVL